MTSPLFDNVDERITGSFNGHPIKMLQGRDLLPGMRHPGVPSMKIVSIDDNWVRTMEDGYTDEIQLDAWYSIIPEG